MPIRQRESFDVALKMRKDAVAALVLQTGDGGLEVTPIDHARTL